MRLNMILLLSAITFGCSSGAPSEPNCPGTDCPCTGTSCVCVPGESCTLDADLIAGCDGGNDCTLACTEMNTCNMTCKNSCNLQCRSGSDCTVDVKNSASINCNASTCAINGNESASVTCENGADCQVACGDSCSVTCSADSSCTLKCPGDSEYKTIGGSGDC